MKKIRVAFIGAGYMASEHAKVFQALEQAILVGVYSPGREKAIAFASNFSISYVANSIEDLFLKTQADLIIVAVPELETSKVCNEVFKYSWCALIEKPVGLNYQEAKKIAEYAKKLNAEAYVALNRRHYSSTINAMEGLSNKSGERLVVIQDQEDLISAEQFGQPKKVLENWMYANSIHLIDYFQLFCRGKIVSVDSNRKYRAESLDLVNARLYYDSGDIGIYIGVWNRPGPWSVSITNYEDRWEMKPLEISSVQRYGSRVVEVVEGSKWDIDFKPGLMVQALEAIKATQGLVNNLPRLEDALESMRLVQCIYEDEKRT
jgi:predicted dehydrogenase